MLSLGVYAAFGSGIMYVACMCGYNKKKQGSTALPRLHRSFCLDLPFLVSDGIFFVISMIFYCVTAPFRFYFCRSENDKVTPAPVGLDISGPSNVAKPYATTQQRPTAYVAKPMGLARSQSSRYTLPKRLPPLPRPPSIGASPWTRHMDPSTNQPYWFNPSTNESTWFDPTSRAKV